MVANLRVCLPGRGWGVGDLVGVGDDGVGCIYGEGYVEGRLVGGLVEAGEGAAGVSGLELSDGVVAGLGLGEIEAAELVVEDAGVADGEGYFSGGESLGEGEGGLLFVFVESDCCRLRLRDRTADRGDDGLKFDLGRIQGDGIAGRVEGEIDVFGAGKGRGFEIGGEGERIVLGVDATRETLGMSCGGGCEGCGG